MPRSVLLFHESFKSEKTKNHNFTTKTKDFKTRDKRVGEWTIKNAEKVLEQMNNQY